MLFTVIVGRPQIQRTPFIIIKTPNTKIEKMIPKRIKNIPFPTCLSTKYDIEVISFLRKSCRNLPLYRFNPWYIAILLSVIVPTLLENKICSSGKNSTSSFMFKKSIRQSVETQNLASLQFTYFNYLFSLRSCLFNAFGSMFILSPSSSEMTPSTALSAATCSLARAAWHSGQLHSL